MGNYSKISLGISTGALVFAMLVFYIASGITHEEEQRDEAAIKIIVEKMENFLFRVNAIQTTSGPPDIEIELLKSSHNTLKQNMMYFGSSLKAEHITEVDLIIGSVSMVDTLFDDTSMYKHFKDKNKTDNQLQPMRDFVKKYKTDD